MVEAAAVPQNHFLGDIRAMSAVLAGDPAAGVPDAGRAIALLQTALAIEIVCIWRYTMISVSVAGLTEPGVGAEFQEQANDERRHMRMLADRIVELGGTPNFSFPELASRRALEYGSGEALSDMVAQNLAAEQAAIVHYRALIPYFEKTGDAATCRMLEAIMQDEENHADDMQDLLAARD